MPTIHDAQLRRRDNQGARCGTVRATGLLTRVSSAVFPNKDPLTRADLARAVRDGEIGVGDWLVDSPTGPQVDIEPNSRHNRGRD